MMMMIMKNKKNVEGDAALQKFRPAKRNVHNLLNPDVLDDETRKLLLDGIMRPPLLSPLHEKTEEPLTSQRKQWRVEQNKRYNGKGNERMSSANNKKLLPEVRFPSHAKQQQQQQQQQKLNHIILEKDEEKQQGSEEELEVHKNGFPCQLRERVNSSSEDLLTAMSARLSDLEKKHRAYQLEIHEMHGKMAELRTKYAEECKERQDAENVIVAIYEEKNELEEQLAEMKQFLADYGLHWRGDTKRGKSGKPMTSTEASHPPTPHSARSTANKSDVKGDMNANDATAGTSKKERQADSSPYVHKNTEQLKMLTDSNNHHSPYRRQERNIVEEQKLKSSNTEVECQAHKEVPATNAQLSAKSIDVKLLERNARILSEYVGVKGVVNNGKSGAICDRDVVHVSVYANGIVVNEGAFRPYGWPLCDAFLHDLIDGYYPYEFKDKYPDGFPVEVIDKSKEMHPAGVRRDEGKNDVQKVSTQAMHGNGRRLDGKEVLEAGKEESVNKGTSSAAVAKSRSSCNISNESKFNAIHKAVSNIHQLDDSIADPTDNSNTACSNFSNIRTTKATAKSNESQFDDNRQRGYFLNKLPTQLITSGGHLVNVRDSIASLLTPENKNVSLINISDDNKSNIERISDYEYVYITQFERKTQRAWKTPLSSASATAATIIREPHQLRCVRFRLRTGETLLMRFEPDNSIAQIRNELLTALPSLRLKTNIDNLLCSKTHSDANAIKTSGAFHNASKENNTGLVELCEAFPLRIFSDYSKSLSDLGIKHNCVLCICFHD